MNSSLVLLIAAIVTLCHPFIFLWYYERKRGRRLIELAQMTATAAAVPPVERAKQEVLSKQHELEAKELALKLANRRLGKLDQAKFDFVSVTTHQLRTPLAAIKWTFHMLSTGQLGPVSDEQKVFAEKGQEATDRAINIVNQLLKVDTGGPEEKASRADYHFVPTDLGELIGSIALLWGGQLPFKKKFIWAVVLNVLMVGLMTFSFSKYLLPMAVLLGLASIKYLEKYRWLVILVFFDSLSVFLPIWNYFGKNFWPNVYIYLMPFWFSFALFIAYELFFRKHNTNSRA